MRRHERPANGMRAVTPISMILAAGLITGCEVAQAGGNEAQMVPTPPVAPSPKGRFPGPPSKPVKEPKLGPIPKVTSAKHIPLPLDPYMTPMGDIHTIDLARDHATAQCMHSLGFSQWTDGTLRSWEPEDYVDADVLGYIDPASATRAGYPRAKISPQLEAAASRPQDRHTATPEEMKAYNGGAARTASGHAIPAKGCLGAAERSIYAQNQALPADPRALADEASNLAEQDSRVGRVLGRWVTCVARRGLDYDHPASARQDILWADRKAGAAASATEKRVAGIDAGCQREVNLIGVYIAAKKAYEQGMVAADSARLRDAKTIFWKWVANARTILARS